jgi:hypothetical protein
MCMIVQQTAKRDTSRLLLRIQQPFVPNARPVVRTFAFCQAKPREHKPERHWLIVVAKSPLALSLNSTFPDRALVLDLT